jgi:hypothetical protein
MRLNSRCTSAASTRRSWSTSGSTIRSCCAGDAAFAGTTGIDVRAVRPETQLAWKLHALAEMGNGWRPGFVRRG